MIIYLQLLKLRPFSLLSHVCRVIRLNVRGSYCKSSQNCCLWPEIRHNDDNRAWAHRELYDTVISNVISITLPALFTPTLLKQEAFSGHGVYLSEAGNTQVDSSSSQTKHSTSLIFNAERSINGYYNFIIFFVFHSFFPQYGHDIASKSKFFWLPRHFWGKW